MPTDDDYERAVASFRAATQALQGALTAVAALNPQEAVRLCAAVTKIVSGFTDIYADPSAEIDLEAEPDLASDPKAKEVGNSTGDGSLWEAMVPNLRDSLPRNIFEYLVLIWLAARRGTSVEKNDIFEAMQQIGLNKGNFGAFNTRLNKMKEYKYIDWRKNKQNSSVIICSDGLARCEDLANCRSGVLTQKRLERLERDVSWANRKFILPDSAVDASSKFQLIK